jgi:hypothetical protein
VSDEVPREPTFATQAPAAAARTQLGVETLTVLTPFLPLPWTTTTGRSSSMGAVGAAGMPSTS